MSSWRFSFSEKCALGIILLQLIGAPLKRPPHCTCLLHSNSLNTRERLSGWGAHHRVACEGRLATPPPLPSSVLSRGGACGGVPATTFLDALAAAFEYRRRELFAGGAEDAQTPAMDSIDFRGSRAEACDRLRA